MTPLALALISSVTCTGSRPKTPEGQVIYKKGQLELHQLFQPVLFGKKMTQINEMLMASIRIPLCSCSLSMMYEQYISEFSSLTLCFTVPIIVKHCADNPLYLLIHIVYSYVSTILCSAITGFQWCTVLGNHWPQSVKYHTHFTLLHLCTYSNVQLQLSRQN